MRIIEQGNKQEEHILTCKKCGTKFGATRDDAFTEVFAGDLFVGCPTCGEKIPWDNPDEDECEKTLTVDNISYPNDFYHFGGENAVDINDAEIQDWIKEITTSLQEAKEDYGVSHGISSGNTIVIGRKYEDEYEIIVAKNYYKASIPR